MEKKIREETTYSWAGGALEIIYTKRDKIGEIHFSGTDDIVLLDKKMVEELIEALNDILESMKDAETVEEKRK